MKKRKTCSLCKKVATRYQIHKKKTSSKIGFRLIKTFLCQDHSVTDEDVLVFEMTYEKGDPDFFEKKDKVWRS